MKGGGVSKCGSLFFLFSFMMITVLMLAYFGMLYHETCATLWVNLMGVFKTWLMFWCYCFLPRQILYIYICAVNKYIFSTSIYKFVLCTI